MKIAIAGGTGFVGSALTNALLSKGHEIFILTRNPKKSSKNDKLHYVEWLHDNSAPETSLNGIEAIINLAGESINSGRWTEERKKRILNSRIESTREIIRIIKALNPKPTCLINASAIGIYGSSVDQTFTENSTGTGNDFLAETVKAWEHEALEAEKFKVRTVLTRFGIILGEEEGALPRMVLPYKLFGGGTVGSGKQWLSWVHIEDVINIILYCLDNIDIHGPVNVVSPHPATMKEFGKTIGRVLHRPHWLPVPGIALKLLLGEMSTLVLDGQKVLPEKLVENGYPFSHSHLEEALSDILQSK